MKPSPLLLLALGSSLTACTTPRLSDYTTSRDSLFYLQQIEPSQVAVGAITSGEGSLTRATASGTLLSCSRSVEAGEGATGNAGEYIRAALVEELAAAGHYTADPDALRIGGNVEHVSLARSVPFGALWAIGLVLPSSNGSEMKVQEEYPFDVGSLAGPTVCRRAIEHFEPAVRALLEEAVRSDQFRALVQQP